MHFPLLQVEVPSLFDAIYSCPGLALLCQVRFYFFLKGIPWSDSGVRFVTLLLFNCLCTRRRCEDGRLLSRHNIDTVRWLSRHKPLLLICPDRPCSTWMIAGVTSQIREKSNEVNKKQNKNEKKFLGRFFFFVCCFYGKDGKRNGALLSDTVFFISFLSLSLIQQSLSFPPSVLSWKRWLMGRWPGPSIVAVSAVDLFSL